MLGSLCCMMQHREFGPPWSLLVEGIFPLELAWVLTPFPKTLFDESVNRGPICAHMHSITLTQKIVTFMPWMSECRQQKNT